MRIVFTPGLAGTLALAMMGIAAAQENAPQLQGRIRGVRSSTARSQLIRN
jgi:hypothetical protein